MTSQILRVLKKLYKYDNGEYDSVHSVSIYSNNILSEKEKSILIDYDWKENKIISFTNHDDVLKKLLSLKEAPALSKKRCLDSFVAGVGGSYLRGHSVLSAWHHLNSLPFHGYEEKKQFKCCWICEGYNDPKNINDSQFQYCLYLGNSYSSNPMYAYLNLQHLIDIQPVVPTESDCSTLEKLFDLLRTSPGNETPGRFEKRLSESKIISGDRYTKRGILDSLTRVGVIPNQFISLSSKSWASFGDVAMLGRDLKNTQGRSDMEMPWAGWLGSLKIDEEKVSELFGEYIRK